MSLMSSGTMTTFWLEKLTARFGFGAPTLLANSAMGLSEIVVMRLYKLPGLKILSRLLPVGAIVSRVVLMGEYLVGVNRMV
jgi:hypothetical protein